MKNESGLSATPTFLILPRVLQLVAFGLALAATLAAILLPSGIVVEEIDGVTNVLTTRLIENLSAGIISALLLALILTALPLAMWRHGWRIASILCVLCLAVFTVIASATIGWYYIPTLLVSIAAVCLPARNRLQAQ